MFKGLAEENADDLNLIRLNAYRSHFNLGIMTSCDDENSKAPAIEAKVEEEELIYEEVMDQETSTVVEEEYLEEEIYPFDDTEYDNENDIEQEIIEETIAEYDDDDDDVHSFSTKTDYEKLFVFKCHLCTHPEFTKMADLTQHCKEEHNSLPSVRCCSDECGKMLSTLRRLIIHKEKHFPDANALKCDTCHRVFSTKSGFEKHKKCHTAVHVCTTCGKCFKEAKTLRWHEATHEKSIEERRSFECCHCQQKFITKQACQNHIGMKHEKVISFFCKICEKGYYTKKALCEHQRTHAERKYSCGECDFKAKTKSALNTHMDVHRNSEEKHFSCDRCTLSFVSIRRLKSHMSKLILIRKF